MKGLKMLQKDTPIRFLKGIGEARSDMFGEHRAGG